MVGGTKTPGWSGRVVRQDRTRNISRRTPQLQNKRVRYIAQAGPFVTRQRSKPSLLVPPAIHRFIVIVASG